MNEKNERTNEGKYKSAHINKISFKLDKKKQNFDKENIIILKESEDPNDFEEKIVKTISIWNKIYFIILILIGIILTLHLLHFFLSEYVRKLFNNNL